MDFTRGGIANPRLESSLVTVRFEPRGNATEVVVVHERVPSAAARKSHEQGWNGCLDGLDAFFVG